MMAIPTMCLILWGVIKISKLEPKPEPYIAPKYVESTEDRQRKLRKEINLKMDIVIERLKKECLIK